MTREVIDLNKYLESKNQESSKEKTREGVGRFLEEIVELLAEHHVIAPSARPNIVIRDRKSGDSGFAPEENTLYIKHEHVGDHGAYAEEIFHWVREQYRKDAPSEENRAIEECMARLGELWLRDKKSHAGEGQKFKRITFHDLDDEQRQDHYISILQKRFQEYKTACERELRNRRILLEFLEISNTFYAEVTRLISSAKTMDAHDLAKELENTQEDYTSQRESFIKRNAVSLKLTPEIASTYQTFTKNDHIIHNAIRSYIQSVPNQTVVSLRSPALLRKVGEDLQKHMNFMNQLVPYLQKPPGELLDARENLIDSLTHIYGYILATLFIQDPETQPWQENALKMMTESSRAVRGQMGQYQGIVKRLQDSGLQSMMDQVTSLKFFSKRRA